MKDIPEIRINFAYLLFFGESQVLAGDKKLETYDQYEKWTNNYRHEWQRHEQTILEALQHVLKLQFYKPVIDVSCAPFFVPKSEPLIMNFMHKPNRFVDVLTHELCHVLLTDNNKIRMNDEKPALDLAETWKKLFGSDHDFHTLVHIPVHALSKYIYLDVLKDSSRLERDIESVKKYKTAKAYVKSWEYVNENGYKEIIGKLHKSYEKVL